MCIYSIPHYRPFFSFFFFPPPPPCCACSLPSPLPLLFSHLSFSPLPLSDESHTFGLDKLAVRRGFAREAIARIRPCAIRDVQAQIPECTSGCRILRHHSDVPVGIRRERRMRRGAESVCPFSVPFFLSSLWGCNRLFLSLR